MTDRVAALRALLRTPDDAPCDARRGHRVTAEGEAGREALKAQLAGAFLAHFLVALDDTFAREPHA